MKNQTGPNTARVRQWLPLLGMQSLAPKGHSCLYSQKQLKTKILIKNGIILILTSILKEPCT